MQGIIRIRDKRYLFRPNEMFTGIISWDIDIEISSRPGCHKWAKLPRRCVLELFELDNPPATVSYLPLLSDQLDKYSIYDILNQELNYGNKSNKCRRVQYIKHI